MILYRSRIVNCIELKSYAKINLGLSLLKKRLDGYHDIITVFQAIDLHDSLTFKRTHSSTFRLTSTGIPIPLNEDNLVHRAFRVFQNRMHVEGGLEIRVEKRIPTGGGLGGGSSNAAVTLTAMDLLWDTRLIPPDLEFMAMEIGSDVPFFIRGGAAIGEGRGERLTPIDLHWDCWVLLVCPAISVSTAWAYSQARIGLTKDEKLTKFRSIFQNNAMRSLRGSLENELEGVVFKRHPLLRLFKEDMYKWDAFYASMSGSGSSVFGLFDRLEQAEAARSFFMVDKRVKTFLCRPISSHSPGAMASEDVRHDYRFAKCME
jgi:4-diphosphocytidyl-2-C-methyl-D-erythritol kinase